MTKTDFPPSIASRPVYGELAIRDGSQHLMIADAVGAEAILDLDKDAPKGFWDNVQIVYIPKDSGDKYVEKLQALAPYSLYIGPSFEAARQRLDHVFSQAHMGLQVYLAGTEGLMGQAMALAMAAGLPADFIQTEHRGSKARRMQCVHCKGFTEDVTTDPFQCIHCGLTLFVRDHYSRRLAAFQGVCVDAEDPGVIPPTEENYK